MKHDWVIIQGVIHIAYVSNCPFDGGAVRWRGVWRLHITNSSPDFIGYYSLMTHVTHITLSVDKVIPIIDGIPSPT